METIDDLRKQFLKFFQERGHAIVPPSSLVPDDPSVLLTTAGMQQFKPYYTNERDPLKDIHASLGKTLGVSRAVSIQPCVRTSDIDEVGDTTHLTFFEMCGNFAFQGAYFKREAIELAWRFLTDELGIPKDKFFVTVFSGDDTVPEDSDSRAIWEDIGIPMNRIMLSGRDTNFWGPTGSDGPCGPTTEIHYDRTGVPCVRGVACDPNCTCGRFLELWNLVFNEFYADAQGKLTPLTAKGVDTGMGLERLALVMFDVPDVFGSPLFSDLLARVLGESPRFPESVKRELEHHRIVHALRLAEENAPEAIRSARIIADHIRASVFLAHEGILPSNVERGYILRRLLRRAALHAQFLELPNDWVVFIVDAVLPVYVTAYPDIVASRANVLAILGEEFEKFRKTLARGLREFERLAHDRRMTSEKLSGEDIFRLFETYGFPIEMSRELSSREKIEVDEKNLAAVRDRHRERSRAGRERKFGGHGLMLDTGEIRAATPEEVERVTRLHTATHMLHAALRELFGPDVRQSGSDITAERFRFDFSFSRKLTKEEIEKIEMRMNEIVRQDLSMEKKEMPFQEAMESGALAFAKGAYPDRVSVYSIPGFSREICGGPHVTHTGAVGEVKILKQEASAAGIRRIRATVLP